MGLGYSKHLLVELDADYQAVLNYAQANDIALPSDEQQYADSELLKKYKATGAWDKDDVFAKFKGTAAPAFKLICWKRLIQMQAVGGLSWTENGVEGDGATGYINTLYNPALHALKQTLNNAGYGWVGTKNPAGTMATVHAQGMNGHNLGIIPNRPSALNYYLINGATATGTTGTQLARVGLNALYRTTADNAAFFAETSSAVNHKSTGMPDLPVFLLASNPQGGAPGLFSTENLQYFYAGAAKTTEHQNIKTILI